MKTPSDLVAHPAMPATINAACCPWISGATLRVAAGDSPLSYESPYDETLVDRVQDLAVVLSDGTEYEYTCVIWPHHDRPANGKIVGYGTDGETMVAVKFCFHKNKHFKVIIDRLQEKNHTGESCFAPIPAMCLCGGQIHIMPYADGTLVEAHVAKRIVRRGLDLFSEWLAKMFAEFLRLNLYYGDPKPDNFVMWHEYSSAPDDQTHPLTLYVCDLDTFDITETPFLIGSTYPLKKIFTHASPESVVQNMVYGLLILIISVWCSTREQRLPYQSLSHSYLSQYDSRDFWDSYHKYWTLIDLFGDDRPEVLKLCEIETKSTLRDMKPMSAADQIQRGIQHFDTVASRVVSTTAVST